MERNPIFNFINPCFFFSCTFWLTAAVKLPSHFFPNITFPQISQDPNDVRLILLWGHPNQQRGFSCIPYRNKRALDYVVQQKKFNTSYQTSVFVIHGLGGNGSYEVTLTEHARDNNLQANFFLISWGKSSGKTFLPEYNNPLTITPEQLLVVGPVYIDIVKKVIPVVWKRTAEYLLWLTEVGLLRPEGIHIVGHSLGAHIAGGAGEIYEQMTGTKIARISGLDPAGPLFEPSVIPLPPYVQRKLTKFDAQFVDCYHTNMGLMGNPSLVDCHVDFKVNNGFLQPGCLAWNQSITANANFYDCSHVYAIQMFRITDNTLIKGCLCPKEILDFKDILNCHTKCPAPVVAGLYTPSSARGYRHISINTVFPLTSGIAFIQPDEACAEWGTT